MKTRICAVLVLLAASLAAQAQVIGIGVQTANAVATSISQCPTLPATPVQAFICIVAPAGAQPFLALSVSGWNGGAPFQLAGLFPSGVLTAGNLVVSAGGNQVKDGGPVPTVPANIVTAPAAIATGHMMVAGTNPLNAVDGGAVPTVPSNIVTFSGALKVGDALQVASTTGQVSDAAEPLPDFSSLTLGMTCLSASLSSGTIKCGAGSSIQ